MHDAAPLPQRLDTPVVVVTGAARGIGQAIATRLHRDGYRLVLADVDVARLHATRDALSPAHAAVRADVTEAADLDALAETAVQQFGRLDVWINNAGLIPSGLLTEQNGTDLSRAWHTNLGGTVHGCRAALHHMLPARRGQVINIASLCAVKPLAGLALYSATKAAVVTLSEGLRREIRGSGVHITCLLPYMVTTDASHTLRPRLVPALRPDDVARAVTGAIRRPRPRIYTPPLLGWALTAASRLPHGVRDAVDDVIRMDELALRPDQTGRRRFRRCRTAPKQHGGGPGN
ncbi:SDR family NAD(P)-dependent oxidoreductase [Streptomyces sp. NPDC096048]|uniref:SDR family NAD(P)-dependent oxidoreductase n=1 Tax=Streptomyces sp. NPDC096048 TaxID=3366072 RepID=UPI003810B532